MADNANISKIDAAAEKAYAEAAAKNKVSETAVEKAVEADAPKAEVKVEAVKKAVKAPAKKKAAPKKKVAAKKAAPKKIAAKKPAPKKVAVAKKAAPKKAAAKNTASNPVFQIKDKIMATAKTTDFTKTAKEVASDVQARAKTAFAKTGEYANEVTEFSKGNVEALVESGKIFFAGAQELARADIETGKTALETVTADVKKMASVKTPTEFMQLQGELARRNFDAAVSFGSKRTEALVKLYNDAFAPISSRVSVAAEKIKKAA
ncbi:phasin family protein [Altererythrobacter arenosus]|uniref:Phasin family protein n=1 Tax=Altererythrobacter arenosus TaxID=3032592 RepID=A0ABY8FM72_9SPHN|nr:phasin family protein [Altererythrobacter sp. CAU 1644]WFL76122.1 phasin family protein [Altererythrobacter sp. CAU 1644]